MKLISNALTLFIIIALVIIWMQGKPKEQASTDLSERELGCLVANIFWEARGEDDLGQAAVAWVTLNRARSPDYPDTVCGVVWQESQFSCFLDRGWKVRPHDGHRGYRESRGYRPSGGEGEDQGPYRRRVALLCS